MISQFEGVKNGESKDAALRITTDRNAGDIALATVVPEEELYPYTCVMLAEKLKVRKHDVVQMIKKFGLRNNRTYHLHIKTGLKTGTHKWSEATYERLQKALDSAEYPRPNLN